MGTGASDGREGPEEGRYLIHSMEGGVWRPTSLIHLGEWWVTPVPRIVVSFLPERLIRG